MSRVVSDRVMALSTKSWSIRKARVLVRDDQTVAVFTNPTGPPTRTFSTTGSTSRSFTTTEGETISARMVGSSCSWPLAKCRQSTTQLTARWTS